MALPDFEWDAFRALAGQLERFVGEPGDSDAEAALAPTTRRFLALLYTSGVTMPGASRIYETAGQKDVLGDLDDPTLGPDVLEPAAYEARVSAFAARIADSATELGTLAEELQRDDLAGMSARAVFAVTAALGEGNRLWDEGKREAAAWEWAFQFDDWGAHALDGLEALHGLLWGAGE